MAREIKINIESLFNDAGFARALRAINHLQTEIGRANAGMKRMSQMAREINQSMSSAAASMSKMGKEASTASTRVGKFADASKKAAAGAERLDDSADEAAEGVSHLGDEADGTNRSLVVVRDSVKALATQTQLARRTTQDYSRATHQASQEIIDAQFRIINATRSTRSFGEAINRARGWIGNFNRVLGPTRQLLSQISQIAGQVARTFGGQVARGIGQAVRSIGSLLSAGARFASLRSTLDSTGRSARRFGADVESGMRQANRASMEFYAAGWSLLMGGQMVGGVGRRMLGGLAGQMSQFLDYETSRTKLGIASSGFESGVNMNPQVHNQLLNQMVFGLQRGEYGAPIPMSAQELAQGGYYYASAIGSPITNQDQADQVARALAPILSVAQFTQTSPETAIKGVLNAAMEFGIDPRAAGSHEDLARIASQFGYLTQVSTLELPDIVETFKMMGPMVNQLGGPDNTQNLNDAMLMTFLTSEMGMRGSMPGRGLRMAMNSFLDPTVKMEGISEELFGGGVHETFFDENMDFKGGLTGFLSNFLALDEGEWQKALAGFFTTNATAALIPIIEQMRSDPEKVMEFAQQIGGDEPMKLTEAAMARYNDSIAGHLQQVKNAWFEVQTAIVDSISGPLKKGLEIATTLFRELADIVNEHPLIAKFLTALVAGVGTMLTFVGALLSVAGTLLILRRAFALTHGSMNLVAALFTSLPHLLLMSLPLLLALGAAAVLLYRAWQSNFLGIQDLVKSFNGDLSKNLDPILDTVELLALEFGKMFAGEVNEQFDNLVDLVRRNREALLSLLAVITAFGKGAVSGFVSVFLAAAMAAREMVDILRKVPGALRWVGSTTRELTGFKGSVEDLAEILGFAFGVLIGGKVLASLGLFDNALTRVTSRLASFILQNVILGSVSLIFRTVAVAADFMFNTIIAGTIRAGAAIVRFMQTQIKLMALQGVSATMTLLAWGAVVLLFAAVGVALVRLLATNEDFRNRMISIWQSISGIVRDFAEGVLIGLILGFQVLVAAVTPVLQVLVAILDPILRLIDGMNLAKFAGLALGAVLTTLSLKLGVELVASLVKTAWHVTLLATKFTFLAVKAIAGAIASTVAWLVALGPAGLIIAGVVAALAGLLILLDQMGVIANPFQPIVDGANLAIGSVALLFDWLHKSNEEMLRGSHAKAVEAYDTYTDQRFERAQNEASNSMPMDVSAFPSDPALRSAYLLDGGNLTPKQWLEKNGMYAIAQNPDDRQAELKQRYKDLDNAIKEAEGSNLPREFTGSGGGPSRSGGPTGIAFIDNLLDGLTVDSVMKSLGVDMDSIMGQIDVTDPSMSYEDFVEEAKKQAFDSAVAKKYEEITGRSLGVDRALQTNRYTRTGYFGLTDADGNPILGEGVDAKALQAATDYATDELEGAAEEFDAVQAKITELASAFDTAIQTIDLPSALKGLYDPFTGGGTGKGTSVAEVLAGYSGTIMTNLQNAVGTDVKLPWQNDFELLMDAAGSGNFLGTDVTGRNLHKVLAPFLETFAAQSGVSVDALLADIPTFFAPEQFIGMGQADLMQATQGLSPDMYKRLDLLGAGTFNESGIDWQELANFGTAQAAAGDLKWNLADFIAESWDISKSEAEAYITANQLDPNVITGQDFFDTKMYADTLGGQVNVLPQEWWDYLMQVTQGGADKTIEMTQAAFDALPDVVKIGFSNMGYSFVLGGNATAQQAVSTAQAIKDNIEQAFGDIPDNLSELLTPVKKGGAGWFTETIDGLVYIKDSIGNIQFTIPASDYSAWVESNNILESEKARMQGLKDDLETLKEEIRALSSSRDTRDAQVDMGGAMASGVGFGLYTGVDEKLSQAKQDAHDLRVDLGWITGEGGTTPQIDVQAMMPSSGDIQKIGAQAAQDFKTGFDTEFATVTAGEQSFKVKITLDREEMLSRLVDTQVQLMKLDDEVYTAKIDIDRTDATTHYNEMVTALRDEYDPATWTTTIDVDKSSADTKFSTITTVFNTSWATKTWTTTLAATDNASKTIGLAIGLASIGFAKTFTATLTVDATDAFSDLGGVLNLLGSVNGYTATATIVTNHQSNFTTTRNAQGGMMFRGGMSLVGEYGPEMLYLPAGSRVVPNSLSEAMLSGMVNRSVGDMVGTRGGFQAHNVSSSGGGAGAGSGDTVVNFYGDNHFHNETDMDQLVERVDYFLGQRQEKARRGQYGSDSARHRGV